MSAWRIKDAFKTEYGIKIRQTEFRLPFALDGKYSVAKDQALLIWSTRKHS